MPVKAGSKRVDEMKVILISAVAQKMLRKYKTQTRAAEALGYDPGIISRICAGRVDRFSVPWLVDLAHRVGCRIRLEVE